MTSSRILEKPAVKTNLQKISPFLNFKYFFIYHLFGSIQTNDSVWFKWQFCIIAHHWWWVIIKTWYSPRLTAWRATNKKLNTNIVAHSPQIYIISVWRKLEKVSPCTGSRTNTNYWRIAGPRNSGSSIPHCCVESHNRLPLTQTDWH